jgi:hypothetical protein
MPVEDLIMKILDIITPVAVAVAVVLVGLEHHQEQVLVVLVFNFLQHLEILYPLWVLLVPAVHIGLLVVVVVDVVVITPVLSVLVEDLEDLMLVVEMVVDTKHQQAP